jgi:hypothetical protein
MLELTASQLAAFQALLLGFAFAGLLTSAFQLIADRPPSFRMLNASGAAALAAVPLLILTAPIVILRNTLRGRRFERRPIIFIALATIIACFWSMVSGGLVLKLAALLIGA